MKIFALILIFAYVAVAFPSGYFPGSASSSSSEADLYVGELQDSADGPIIHVGSLPQMNTVPDRDMDVQPYGPPSCKLGPPVGPIICLAKCIARGHKGGYCKGKVCTCVD